MPSSAIARWKASDCPRRVPVAQLAPAEEVRQLRAARVELRRLRLVGGGLRRLPLRVAHRGADHERERPLARRGLDPGVERALRPLQRLVELPAVEQEERLPEQRRDVILLDAEREVEHPCRRQLVPRSAPPELLGEQLRQPGVAGVRLLRPGERLARRVEIPARHLERAEDAEQERALGALVASQDALKHLEPAGLIVGEVPEERLGCHEVRVRAERLARDQRLLGLVTHGVALGVLCPSDGVDPREVRVAREDRRVELHHLGALRGGLLVGRPRVALEEPLRLLQQLVDRLDPGLARLGVHGEAAERDDDHPQERDGGHRGGLALLLDPAPLLQALQRELAGGVLLGERVGVGRAGGLAGGRRRGRAAPRAAARRRGAPAVARGARACAPRTCGGRRRGGRRAARRERPARPREPPRSAGGSRSTPRRQGWPPAPGAARRSPASRSPSRRCSTPAMRFATANAGHVWSTACNSSSAFRSLPWSE